MEFSLHLCQKRKEKKRKELSASQPCNQEFSHTMASTLPKYEESICFQSFTYTDSVAHPKTWICDGIQSLFNEQVHGNLVACREGEGAWAPVMSM